MADNALKAAADRIAELLPDDPVERRPKAKLPYARSYLKAARWGFDQMVKCRLLNEGFIFHLVSIATVARAVPIVLEKRDRKISGAHDAVIGEWWQRSHPATTPVIHFLKAVRDIALHEGALDAIAVKSDLRIGEGRNAIVIRRDYDVDLVDENVVRHDLLARLRAAFDWLEAQLAEIEAKLPDDG